MEQNKTNEQQQNEIKSIYAIKVNGEVYQRFDTFEEANRRALEMVSGEHSGSKVQVVPETLGTHIMMINGCVVFDKKEDIAYTNSPAYLKKLKNALLQSKKYKNAIIEIEAVYNEEWFIEVSQECKRICNIIYYEDLLKEQVEEEDTTTSKKNDRLDNKVRMELLPMDALEAIARIYTFGAEKYGVGTWRQLPDGSERYRAALLRHMTAECKGEELDPESGLPHVFHEAWNALARVAIYLDNHKEKNKIILCGKEVLSKLKELEK